MHGSKHRRPRIKQEKEKKHDEVVEEVEKDLTEYIKDRVALMQQAFCVLRERELLAMAPGCLRALKVDDLQELCLDEVLGISSKRLRAILDGYDCPSDTDSSQASAPGSPPMELETISLDSISSEDEQPAAKAKPKKKSRHHSRRKRREDEEGGEAEQAPPEQTASRGPAGMTVLELLELQARARAIRAQLQAVQVATGSAAEKDSGSVKAEDDTADEDDVVIKEEPPEVVEVVSSEDDGKCDQNKAATKTLSSLSSSSFAMDKTRPDRSTSTLIVSMPASSTRHPPRKIKLKRNNLLVSVSNVTKTSEPVQEKQSGPIVDLDKSEDLEVAGLDRRAEKNLNERDHSKRANDNFIEEQISNLDTDAKQVNKRLKNKGLGKLSKKRKSAKSKGSDEDEIMLELSDTEKMDLLDSFNSDSSSDTDSAEDTNKSKEEFDNSKGSEIKNDETLADAECTGIIDLDGSEEVGHGGQISHDEAVVEDNVDANEDVTIRSGIVQEEKNSTKNVAQVEKSTFTICGEGDLEKEEADEIRSNDQESAKPDMQSSPPPDSARECDKTTIEICKKKKKFKKSKDSKRHSGSGKSVHCIQQVIKSSTEGGEDILAKKKPQNIDKHLENSQREIGTVSEGADRAEVVVELNVHNLDVKNSPDEELSEGECSYSSDGIEITELKHDIVCISDEEGCSVDSTEAGRPKKKKYRKRRNSSLDDGRSDDGGSRIDSVEEKDAIMEVDSILCQDDPITEEGIVSMVGKSTSCEEGTIKKELASKEPVCENAIDIDDYEVFEISDDSSGDETGNCLSKEPTTEEIEELSRKIDSEIEREEIVFEKNITGDVDDEMKQEILKSVGASREELSDSSWKERWLKSDKVKKVLATSNLCNALRKKNKELKMKLVEDIKGRGKYNPTPEDKSNELGSGDITDRCKDSVVIKEVEDWVETDVETQKKDDIAEERVIKITNEIEIEKNKNDIEEKGGETENAANESVDVGSVDFYMTLTSSTKYVDPVADPEEERRKAAMAKDARQLMKMYRRLLKIHKKAEGGGKKDKKKKRKDKQKKSGKDKAVEGDKNNPVMDVR